MISSLSRGSKQEGKHAKLLKALFFTCFLSHVIDCSLLPQPIKVEEKAADGVVLDAVGLAICNRDIGGSGYGVCGWLRFYPPGTLSNGFDGEYYADGEYHELEEDEIIFDLLDLYFERVVESSGELPSYDISLRTEARSWPIVVSVEGTIELTEEDLPYSYVGGTMHLEAFGEEEEVWLPGTSEGGSYSVYVRLEGYEIYLD